jgi:hypothetical protein
VPNPLTSWLTHTLTGLDLSRLFVSTESLAALCERYPKRPTPTDLRHREVMAELLGLPQPKLTGWKRSEDLVRSGWTLRDAKPRASHCGEGKTGLLGFMTVCSRNWRTGVFRAAVYYSTQKAAFVGNLMAALWR